MDPTVQQKMEEFVQAAIAAGEAPADVLPALSKAYRQAVIASATLDTLPVPNMSAQDLTRIVDFVADKGSIDDPQDVFRLLRRAIAERNQPAFWRYLFVLGRCVYRQYHYIVD